MKIQQKQSFVFQSRNVDIMQIFVQIFKLIASNKKISVG